MKREEHQARIVYSNNEQTYTQEYAFNNLYAVAIRGSVSKAEYREAEKLLRELVENKRKDWYSAGRILYLAKIIKTAKTAVNNNLLLQYSRSKDEKRNFKKTKSDWRISARDRISVIDLLKGHLWIKECPGYRQNKALGDKQTRAFILPPFIAYLKSSSGAAISSSQVAPTRTKKAQPDAYGFISIRHKKDKGERQGKLLSIGAKRAVLSGAAAEDWIKERIEFVNWYNGQNFDYMYPIQYELKDEKMKIYHGEKCELHLRNLKSNLILMPEAKLLGGRFSFNCWSHMNLRKETRDKLIVAGQPTDEIDLSACHLSILLNQINMGHKLLGADPYNVLARIPKDVLWSEFGLRRDDWSKSFRHLVKKGVAAGLNVKTSKNHSYAAGAVANLTNKENDKLIIEIDDEGEELPELPEWQVWAARFADIPSAGTELDKGRLIMRLIVTAYPEIEQFFGEDTGRMLFIPESKICQYVLRECHLLKIPVLSCHDGFIVRIIDIDIVKNIIKCSFQKTIGEHSVVIFKPKNPTETQLSIAA